MRRSVKSREVAIFIFIFMCGCFSLSSLWPLWLLLLFMSLLGHLACVCGCLIGLA